MKRYIMIQELAKAVHIDNRPEIDSNHSYAIAEALLAKAEELGMKLTQNNGDYCGEVAVEFEK